ncbi:MAG: YgiT-type zinc finger protein [Thermodesulfobacteriota bacterium]
MTHDLWRETFVEQQVTYVLEYEGRVVIVEHVPARVCIETGERLFAPDIVEHLQRIVWEQRTPSRVIETPVFEFAS